jgi:L,D-transpeptidase-like protein/putative peptidoglycan binding protein
MSRRVPVLCATLGVAAIMAPAAIAQVPPPPVPPPPPAPVPAAGKASFTVAGGLPTKKVRYLSRGQRVVVRGTVKPFVAGQSVRLEIVRRGKVVSRHDAPVRQGRKGAGRFTVRFKTRRRGVLRLVVKHTATPQQQAFRARDKRIDVVSWSAGAGAKGTHVLLMQRALLRLGFAVPVTGYFDSGTARGVTAFRKTNSMGSSGYASSAVFDRLARGGGAFRLRYPRAGRHVEFDWSRQVLVLADRGRPWRTYHASSGKASTPTVFGTFRFYRKQLGTNSHGMVDSNYFIGGYAIHGYASVPSYPASHGCIRVPIPNADEIDQHISLGETIYVYA